MSLLSTELFEKALVTPLKQGANKIYIVSGYGTAMMAMRHIEYAKKLNKKFAIRLIIGMTSRDGIEIKNHLAFKELQSSKFDVDFKCDYVFNMPAVHSKVYTWFANNDPIAGFIGSANYTQNAFSTSMREVLTEVNPITCLDYYNSLIGETINCEDNAVNDLVTIYERELIVPPNGDISDGESEEKAAILGLPTVTLKLVDRNGEVPARSGLNWGQREGREHNQAYLNIPAEIGRSDFFPERFETFSIITDDDKQMICVRAQDAGKGLHTTLNNSLLGEYFRFRLGLRNGEFVTKEHLLRYGRSDVTIYKIDEENYYMDFSV
jgi:HKD family nuclease